MLKMSIAVPKKSRQSEYSSLSVGGRSPPPVGINIQIIKELKQDNFDLRNKIAGLVVVDADKDKDKSSVVLSQINIAAHTSPRTTIMNRKSTNAQMQLRRTRIVHPVQLLQNTYRMEPYKSFDNWIVMDIIKEVFKHNLREFIYEPRAAVLMVKGLSEEIKYRVKLENYDRCRIICLVTIVQRLHQNFRQVCRTLLDVDRDQMANYVYHGNRTIYAVGTVYGIYFE